MCSAIRHRHDPDPARSYTLPAELYTDPAVLAQEAESIFERSWHFAAHDSDLAETGSYVTGEVAGRAFVVARGADGTVRAFDNLCPARPHALVEGRGRVEALACRVHGVTLAPDAASTWRVDRLASLVFVCPGTPPAPLAATFPGLADELRQWVPQLDRLRFAARITSDFEANWKVMVDNSIECYHCAVAHPDFQSLLDLDSYRIVNHGCHATHTGRAGRQDNTAYAFDEASTSDFASWWMWPNLLLGPFPGRSNLTVHQILPTGPETTREHFDFYFLDNEPDEAERAAVTYFRDVLRPQDVALCESVQRGLRSRGYRDGRLVDDALGSAVSERNLHLFHGLVLDALEGEP